MSAFDKLLGRTPPPAPAEGTDPLKVGLFDGPFGRMLASVIPPQAIEKMGGDLEAFLNYVKAQFELIIRQNTLLIDQQQMIMAQNADIIALLQGKNADELSDAEPVAAATQDTERTDRDAGSADGGSDGERPRRTRARKPAASGSVDA